MSMIRCYRDLDVWQVAMDLAVLTYEVTERYPRSELFGLTAHTRKSSVSIPSNIAEGQPQSTPVYVRHVLIATGSCGELDTQFEVARRLSFLNNGDHRAVEKLITRTGKMLHGLAHSLGHVW